MYRYLLFIWRGTLRNGFKAGKIHNEGRWKEWALEIETFFVPSNGYKVEISRAHPNQCPE
jgi:hypothetical protein